MSEKTPSFHSKAEEQLHEAERERERLVAEVTRMQLLFEEAVSIATQGARRQLADAERERERFRAELALVQHEAEALRVELRRERDRQASLLGIKVNDVSDQGASLPGEEGGATAYERSVAVEARLQADLSETD
jgi:hypothetical protein